MVAGKVGAADNAASTTTKKDATGGKGTTGGGGVNPAKDKTTGNKGGVPSGTKPQQLTPRTMQIMNMKSGLKPERSLSVFPEKISFDGVHPGFLYVLTFSVRNIDIESHRIRILPPSTSYFKLNYIPVKAVASGLDIRAEVEFQVPDNNNNNMDIYKDKLMILSGKEKIELPLEAIAPRTNIEFDGFVNLGPVVIDNSGWKDIEIKNTGSKEGSFKIIWDQSIPNMKISPSEGILGPGTELEGLGNLGNLELNRLQKKSKFADKMKISVSFDGKELGPFRTMATVKIPGEPDRILDISAQVVEQRLELVMEDKLQSSQKVDFGGLFYGQERETRAILVNNGPQPMSYNIWSNIDYTVKNELYTNSIKENGEEGNDMEDYIPQSSEENEDIDLDSIIIYPAEGLIEPYGQAAVSFTFKPKEEILERGFRGKGRIPSVNFFAMAVTVEAAESNQKIELSVLGKAVKPELELSQKVLRFGECPMNDRRDIAFTMKNKSDLPLPFEFSDISIFKATPKKAVIRPFATQSIVVSFIPSQMGDFKKTINIALCNGIVSLPLRLLGSSNLVGNRKELVGGVEKIPDDFKPKFKFVQPEIGGNPKTSETKPKWNRPKAYENIDLGISSSWDEGEDCTIITAKKEYTFSIQELEKRDQMKKEYADFLVTKRLEREKKEENAQLEYVNAKLKRKPRDTNGVDLGIERSLVEPIIPLPAPVQEVWLHRPIGGTEEGPPGRANISIDENRLILKKFKPRPTTQAEMRDCTKVLSPQELLYVMPSCKVLDFGKVCVNSENVKNFAISNNLSQPCLIALSKQDGELSKCGPSSQMCPGGSTAGFDIHFTSSIEDNFKKVVTYTLNEHHTFKFIVTAEVVPIELELSTYDLNMEFPEDLVEQLMTTTLKMNNPGNAPSEFYWADRGAFNIKPEQGNIAPFSSVDLTVTWRPSPGFKNEETLSLHVPSGRDLEMKVSGFLPETKCTFLDKKLDFGTLAVGTIKEQKLRIKNTGQHPAVFFVEALGEQYGITISPAKAQIQPGQFTELQVKLHPKTARHYEKCFISISIRGGKTLRCPVVATAIIPDVGIVEEGFHFRGVTVGAFVKYPITLENSSSIMSAIVLNMTNFCDFKISEMKSEVSLENMDDGTVLALDTSNIIEGLPPGEDEKNAEDDDDLSMDDNLIRKWKISLPARTRLKSFLVFVPETSGDYDFELPLYLWGLQNDNKLRVPVTAQGLAPTLVMSNTEVDFEDRVVALDPSSRMSYSKDLFFYNQVDEGLTWTLDDSALREEKEKNPGAPTIFFLSPLNGDLAAGEKVCLRATFCPQNSENYYYELPMYLNNQKDTSRPYLTLVLKGSGVFPRLTFDREQVEMPIVPVGVKSIAQFTIENDGYTDLDIAHRFPVHMPVPFELNYLQGNKIGTAMPKLQVEVSYKSDKASSFRVRLDFYDCEGNRFSIPIVGTCDNCTLTNYPFLTLYKDRYSLYGSEGSAIALHGNNIVTALQAREIRLREQQRKQRQAQRQASIRAMYSVGEESKGKQKKVEAEDALHPEDDVNFIFSKAEELTSDPLKSDYKIESRSLELLAIWLSENCTGQPIKSIPGSFLETRGKLAIEMIENLCGKSFPGKVKTFSNKRKEKVNQLMGQYHDLVLFLKERGCLLNEMQPEELLSKDDYIYYKEHIEEKNEDEKITPAKAKELKQIWENNWQRLSNGAWLMLIYQSLKTFVLAKITEKSFKSLPGVFVSKKKGASDGDPEMHESNIYTTPELVLLNWVHYHTKANLPPTAVVPKIVGFQKDFENGSLICHLLSSHLPELSEEGGPLHEFIPFNKIQDLDSPENRDINAQKAIAGLKSIGLTSGFTEEDILAPGGRDMLLLMMTLYQTLPQFLPKTTIEFKGQLGAPIKKCIELKNPSSKTIRYKVEIKGDTDFTQEKDEVEIPPMSAIDFPVQFIGRFSTPAEARLIFWAQKDGCVNATHMVFTLKSNMTSRKPVETIEIADTIYELRSVPITIKNPYDKDSKFDIVLDQNFLEPLYFKPEGPTPTMVSKGKGKKRPQIVFPRPDRLVANSDEEENVMNYIRNPISTNIDSLVLKAGETVEINIDVLGFYPGRYSSNIIFIDPEVGEFVFELMLTLDFPNVLQTIHVDIPPNSAGSILQELKLPSQNANLQKAMQIVLEKLPGPQKTKVRPILLDLLTSTTPETNFADFKAELNSPYYQFHFSDQARIEMDATGKRTNNRINLATVGSPQEDAKPGDLNKFFFQFQPQTAGTYPARILLYPTLENAPDFRIYELESFVQVKPVETKVTFKAPARQVIVQEIPILNNGDEKWQLNAVFQGSVLFSGPKTLEVEPGEQANFPITFKPRWICEENCTLLLKTTNNGTLIQFEFNLTGVGEEPLAEGQINVRCKARETITEKIKLNNFAKEQLVFAVDTDLQHVAGDKEITVPPGGSANYCLYVTPQISGSYGGQITFTAPSGEYIWFPVEVVVGSPAEESTIEVTSEVRKASAIEIVLDNPTDDYLEFEVQLEGDGLLGDTTFTLPPGVSRPYQLMYSPLIAKAHLGSISFLNNTVGQFWYKLKLLGMRSAPIDLGITECSVGTTKKIEIEIENPIGKNISLSTKTNNKQNFTIEPKNVVLGAYAIQKVYICYSPSSLGKEEFGKIILSNALAGKWEYDVCGVGILPGVMEEHTPTSTVGEISSYMFTFKNPFSKVLTLDVDMKVTPDSKSSDKEDKKMVRHAVSFDESDEQDMLSLKNKSAGDKDQDEIDPVFTLLIKKAKGIILPPFASMQIPISFSPKEIEAREAVITLKSAYQNNPLNWIYPIKGIAEASTMHRFLYIKCKAKTTIRKEVELPLNGLTSLDKPETFDHAIDAPAEVKAHVDRSLFVVPIKNTIKKPTDTLKYILQFEPLKPMTGLVEFVVIRANGGRWRYEIKLEVSPPDPDDTIHIEAAVNTTSVVNFRLCNRFMNYAPFEAMFSGDSAISLSLSPTSGVLTPYGTDGTKFTLSFSPVEYGKLQKGKLIITTEEIQWVYNIIGCYPGFEVPKGITSKVSSRLDSSMRETMRRKKEMSGSKNIIRQNMTIKSLKSTSKLKGKNKMNF